MYWARQHYTIRIVYLVLSFCVTISCTKKNGVEISSEVLNAVDPTKTQLPEPTDEPQSDPSMVYSKCIEGESAVEECLVDVKPSYTYNTDLNGRTDEGRSLEGVEGSLSVTIPRGFYEDQTVKIKDVDLVGANILSGKTIFGINGGLNVDPDPDCNNSTLIDTGSPNSTLCRFSAANKYAYQNSLGGRSDNCEITTSEATGSSVKGSCWFDSSLGSKYIYDRQVYYPQCAVGIQSTQMCKALQGEFLHTVAYGGRSVVCPNDTIIDYKCFVGTPNMTVYRITACNENPEIDSGRNNYACFPTKVGNWVYDQPYGGRDKNCADDNNGGCYFQFSTKAASSAALPNDPTITTSDNIKVNEIIFDITGTYTTDGFYWGSGAHRDPGLKRMIYQKPPGPEPAIPPYGSVETSLSPSAAAPTNYRFVPKIATDTEGVASQNVNRVKDDTSPWGDTQCGQSNGAIDARIADCRSVLGANATWDGREKGNAGQGEWKLVARKNVAVGESYEVWLDNSTGLLWSSRVSPLSSGLNWCKASGNSFSNKIDEKMREDDPAGICNQATNQYQQNGDKHPISACAEGFSGYLLDDTDTKNGFLSTGTNQNGKAGLKALPPANKASGRVFWRLPTAYDYMLANHNGLRNVLPDANSGEEWTATTYSGSRNKAWSILISNGYRRIQPKTSGYAVRCVGR